MSRFYLENYKFNGMHDTNILWKLKFIVNFSDLNLTVSLLWALYLCITPGCALLRSIHRAKGRQIILDTLCVCVCVTLTAFPSAMSVIIILYLYTIHYKWCGNCFIWYHFPVYIIRKYLYEYTNGYDKYFI